MEPPTCTGYQKPFASLEGNAAHLADGASPAEGKILPYYMGRWTSYSPEWKTWLFENIKEVSADQSLCATLC